MEADFGLENKYSGELINSPRVSFNSPRVSFNSPRVSFTRLENESQFFPEFFESAQDDSDVFFNFNSR